MRGEPADRAQAAANSSHAVRLHLSPSTVLTVCPRLSNARLSVCRRYSGGKSLEDTRASLCEKVPQEFYTRKLWPDTIKPHVRERIGFDQDMSLVDVMGWHLVSRCADAGRSGQWLGRLGCAHIGSHVACRFSVLAARHCRSAQAPAERPSRQAGAVEPSAPQRTGSAHQRRFQAAAHLHGRHART